MIPARDPVGSETLPVGATFWTPKASQIEEEGFGYFRNVWRIVRTPVAYARAYLRDEQALVTAVDELATNDECFDRIARAIEEPDAEAPDLSWDERIALEGILRGEEPLLDGLDLGVGGLVYALASVGAFPAASCRGHPGFMAWSECPVVLVAIDEARARTLESLAAETGCRFDLDANRRDLLAVHGRSVLDMMNLASAILAARPSFRPKPRHFRHRPKSNCVQATLL